MPDQLENRIKELCAKAIELPDSSPALNEVIKELQAVLHQHLLGLGEADLPRDPREEDRRERRGARAHVNLAALQIEMNSAQILKAQEMADEWKKLHPDPAIY